MNRSASLVLQPAPPAVFSGDHGLDHARAFQGITGSPWSSGNSSLRCMSGMRRTSRGCPGTGGSRQDSREGEADIFGRGGSWPAESLAIPTEEEYCNVEERRGGAVVRICCFEEAGTLVGRSLPDSKR